MTTEKNMTMETVPTPRVPQSAPGFDPMELAREVVNKDGEKAMTLELRHKKHWFRLACPNGGVVLNPLRVTDQMAIFEARLFADTADRNPLASFTATRSADKATGGQYIRAAQEEALNEALECAGFSLQLYKAMQAGQTETVKKAPAPAEVQEVQTPPVTEQKQAAKTGQAVSKEPPPTAQAAEQPRPVTTPADPTPQALKQDRPAPAAPQPRGTAHPAPEKKEPVPTVVDISAGRPKETAPQADTQPENVQTTLEDHADTEADAAAPAYNADMAVEEICQVMTLDQAKAIKVQEGTCRGWTLEQVAKDRPSSLKWLLYASTFADNVLKAAAKLVLDDLELKMAG